ncbi:unnamed protein product (mitochondrion) [Musa hybrid cultivar]
MKWSSECLEARDNILLLILETVLILEYLPYLFIAGWLFVCIGFRLRRVWKSSAKEYLTDSRQESIPFGTVLWFTVHGLAVPTVSLLGSI